MLAPVTVEHSVQSTHPLFAIFPAIPLPMVEPIVQVVVFAGLLTVT
jgi:hypothetical protein